MGLLLHLALDRVGKREVGVKGGWWGREGSEAQGLLISLSIKTLANVIKERERKGLLPLFHYSITGWLYKNTIKRKMDGWKGEEEVTK